jgi:hypothetical protein
MSMNDGLDEPSNAASVLNEIEWTEAITFEAYGVCFAIRVNDPSIVERISSHLPPLRKHTTRSMSDILYSLKVDAVKSVKGSFHSLYCGSQERLRTQNLETLFTNLEHSIELDLALNARNKIFVHAGVVGWEGRAILIPGRSRSGKTTLVSALVRVAGATYYSDEFAVLDPNGWVHPYPRLPRIRTDEGALNPGLGDQIRFGTKALPVGLVAVLQYRADACWQPSILSPAEAILALLDNTIPARDRPRESLTMLRAAAANAVSLKGKRGEAEQAVDQMLKYLS